MKGGKILCDIRCRLKFALRVVKGQETEGEGHALTLVYQCPLRPSLTSPGIGLKKTKMHTLDRLYNPELVVVSTMKRHHITH